MGKGWISVYRKIKDNVLWQDKPFSKGQAWIDILLDVNHKKNRILFDNKIIEVKPGEKITSLRKLGQNWGWSRTKVKNFLDFLKNENMISYFSDTKKTVIKVLNYSDYQQLENNESDMGVTQKRQSSDSEVTQKNTNNNVNNVNNDNNDNTYIHDDKNSEPVDKSVDNLGQAYEKYFHQTININHIQMLQSYLAEMKEEVIIDAMKRAEGKDRPFDYTKSILNAWTNRKVKTIADIKKLDEEYEKKKSKPDNKANNYKWKDEFIDFSKFRET